MPPHKIKIFCDVSLILLQVCNRISKFIAFESGWNVALPLALPIHDKSVK